MPFKPRKPCAHPGCRELTSGRFCETHAKEVMKRYNQYSRDPNANKRYGRRWKRIQAAYISVNPLCEICKGESKLVPATTVHHKIKLTDGGTNAKENLQALCASCHSRLHVSEGDYF
ncbi:MAG: HNH endonuclease [Defluviitaleaceae bacterium]|nr:HNH endonuclease [Defluviitaleaceae bacterium]